MRKIIIFILTLCSANIISHAQESTSVFHRLLIFNEQDELLVVKIKNVDAWVTPGLYQTDKLSIKEGLDSIASTYGITLTSLKLRGAFSLKRKSTGEVLLRNYFVAKVDGWGEYFPDLLEEVRWLPLQEAYKVITFPSINMFTEKVMSDPDIIWGGALLSYKIGDSRHVEILEDFYSLSK